MIEVIQLSNYFRPEIKEVSSKDFVLNGDKNSFYNEIIDRYNGSPTNRAVIDSYAKYIYGKGLCSKEQSQKPMIFAKIKMLLGKKDLRSICADYSIFGEASMELIYSNGKLSKVVHVARNKIAPEKMNESGDITGYYFSQDFCNETKNPSVRFGRFGYEKPPKNGSLIYVISTSILSTGVPLSGVCL